MALRFEWDADKADTNLAKHGVSFQEATTVFRDSSHRPLPIRITRKQSSDSSISVSQTVAGCSWYRTKSEAALSGSSVLGERPAVSKVDTKGTAPNPKPHREEDTMRREYDFSKGIRGKHAAQHEKGTNVVVLDPDVAAEFRTAEDVNEALRAVAELVRRRTKRTNRKPA